MLEAKIHVEGLAQVARSLRAIDAEAAKRLRLQLNVSANILIDRTRPQIPTRTGRARASLKAASTRTSVRVTVGGTRAPYYPWLDFGGRTGPRRSVVRPFYQAGRYLYPTLARVNDEIARSIDEGIRDIARSVGLDVDR